MRNSGFGKPLALVAIALVLAACPGAAPPVPAPPASGTSGVFTVTVNPVGPTLWTYAVTTTGSTNITSVELLSPGNGLNGCTITVPRGASSTSSNDNILITTGTAAGTTFTFSVDCDKPNGNAHIRVSDGTNTGLISPIAGPFR